MLIGRLGLGEGTGRAVFQRTLVQLYDATLVVMRMMVNALVLILVVLVGHFVVTLRV